MLSRTAKSGNKHGAKRALSILLSGVLTVTLLQAFPATSNARAPLGVALVARADDMVDGESVLLGESNLRETSPSTVYRLDIVPECGLLDHIGDIAVAGVTDNMGNPVTWNVQSDNANFVGTPEKLELVLDNLRIIRETGDLGYVDCPLSRVSAWLVEESLGLGSHDPQGTASYVINDSNPIPSMYVSNASPSIASPRLVKHSDGFEIEWNEYLGSRGFTPAGYTLRYRDVTNNVTGAWIYSYITDGRNLSAVVGGLLPGVLLEAQVAPTVRNCEGDLHFGKFANITYVSQFGVDENEPPVGNPQTTGKPDVESQCFSACVPTETVVFDGEKLATILKFESTVPCDWTVPSNYTSSTVDAYVVGGGGGGGAAGGGGGGGGGFNTSIDLPIAIDDTWTVRVGTGGVGSDLGTMRGDSGRSSSVTYPGSNGDETITALGGGGGGSEDQSGENSGGDGTYTGETLKLTFGGAGSGSQGTEGLERTLFDNRYYGVGGSGGDGSASGSSFIDGIFASGGGGGAVCSAIDELNYPGGTSQNGGSGGYCGGNSQPGSRDGNDATANTGGGGGGGASDADAAITGINGAGGDGASGVIYIVHTEEPLARYIPSGCVDFSGECSSWVPTNGNGELAASTTGAPDIISSTSSPALNGSTLQSSFPVVQGGPYDAIDFPVLLASNYTFFSVARYNKTDNGKYRRIFDGKSGNWLSGFHSGVSGVAYHGDEAGWIGGVEETDPKHGFNWVLSTDARSMYRSNGIPIDHSAGPPGAVPDYVTINNGSFGINNQLNMEPQTSDFQVADVLFFDRELSTNEYLAVEAYLSNQYGICTSNCPPLVFSTSSLLPDGESGTPYLQTIAATSTYGNPISYAVLDTTPWPAELSFNTMTGELSGTPATALTLTFTVEATDTVTGETAQREFTVTFSEFVDPPPEPPVFETDSTLQGGKVNQYYTQTIVATSPQPLVFLVVDPSNFPQGLELDSNEGIISGTPEIVGNYSFTIEVNDTVNNQSAFRVFTIAITEALQITSAESAKILFNDTYPPVSDLVSELLGPGISATNVKVNGESEFNSQNAPSFGTFTRGADSVGIEDGIVLSPQNVESFQRDKELDPGQLGPFGNIILGNIFDAIENLLRRAKTWKFASDGPSPGDGPLPISVDGFYEVCNTALDEECANNTTSLEFELSPTAGQRFLKFEYAIAGTEPTEVEAFNFPDGFALFVGGLEETDNCALIPDGMLDAATGETIGFSERYLSVGNLRLVGLSRTVDSDSSLKAVDVSSVLSCVVDTAGYPANEPVSVAMVIANANDDLFAPAVFLKSGSVRFESFGISTDALPNGTVDENYLGHTFETTGGVGPFTFALAQGAELPAGLDLSSSGSITGIPTAAGTFTFGIVATDGASNVSTQNFTLVIDPEPEKPGVRNLSADGYESSISWDQPLDAPDGMTYDVTAGPDENSLIELSNGNESPNSTGITTTSYSQFAEALAAREGDDFVVRVVAHWPTGETSTVTKTFTNYRDVCPLVASCGTTGTDTPLLLPHWKKIKSEIVDAKTAQGNRDAFDGALQVKIGSTYAEAKTLQCDASTAAQISDENVGILGHSIVCSSEEVSGLSVQLSRFFFESSMWTRTLVSVQNNSNTDFTGHIWLKSNMGSDDDTRYEASSNGTDGGFTADDAWAVTGDTGYGDPVAIHMFGQGLQDSPEDPPERNRDGSDYVIPQYALEIAAGDSAKRAWFTGLVGYTNGGYIGAVGNAISAAEIFPAYSNDWTAEQPLFNPPTLVAGAGIPITSCDNTDTTQFVAMFSSDAVDRYGDSVTDNVVGGEDSNLLNSLCQSFDVRIFDGGDGSVDHWSENLDGAQALVFPEMYSEFNLLDVTVEGAPLISADVLEELQSWNNPSHPIIFTGAGSHIKDIGALLSVDLQEIQTTRDQGPFERSEGVSFAAPEQLTYINDVASLDFRNADVSTLIGLSFEISYQTLYQSGNSDLIVPAATFTNNHHSGGRVYYLGYDWHENAQADGSTNWSNLLEMAVSDTLFTSDGNLPEDDRFLQGDFVEVGIGGNGHFGSTGAAPDGYHPRDAGGGEGPGGGSSANRLGFVSDRDREGWGVGQDDGDFFVPGTPFEGFGVDVGGTSYFNNHEDTDIARLSEVTDVTPERQQSTWTSQVMSNGLQVTQVAAVPVNDQRLDVTVTLTNTSDVALEDVYYARQVDNDANVYACRENGGGWSSLNTVEAQASTNDGLSLVSSTMMDDCNDDEAPTDLSAPHSYLGMVSTDPNSVAALQYDEEYGFDGFGSQKAVDFVTGVLKNDCVKRGNESCLRVNITPGAQVFGDSGIGLGFDLGTIEPGSTKTVTFSYILSPDQAQEIIDEHNNENEIVSPVLTASKNSFVAVVDSAFNLLAADWIDSQAGGAVSYFTVSPELPSGLSLNSTTGQISGTSTELLSTSSFTLTAHNLAGSSSVEFLLAVTDGPYLFNESGALMASWPSPSSNVVPEYEYSYSGDGGASWTESVTIENTTSPVMSVNLSATVGAEYIFRVRAAGEQEWFESEPFYFGLTGCSSINSQLRVLMLSAQSTVAAQGTNPATSDSNIWMAACSSPLVSVEIFDGQGYGAGAVKGSADVWRTALEDIDVVVIPRLSSGDLEDSDLMSEAAFQVLNDWVESGGRLILTGAASYVNDLNRLTYMDDPEYLPIESAQVSEVTGVRRVDGANTSLPATLPTFGNDGLDLSQASPDLLVSNYGETSSWLSPSLVTSFLKGKGWVVALSNEFTTADANWNKVLRQSIQSSVNPFMLVSDGGTFWYMNSGELHSQLDTPYLSAPGGIVRIGSETSSTSISCINTPSNPAIIYRKTEGTTVKCGKVNIDDGLVDRPVEVRLTRFFAASSPWVKTSVSIENVDSDNEYRNSVWFGGELGLGDKPLLEVDGQKQTSQNEHDYESPITVASAGDYVRTDYDSVDGHMVIRINSNFPSEVFGGLRLDENSAFTRDQMWTKSLFMLEPEESATFSWFESFAIYEPGCDRMASLNAWNKTEAFYLRALQENSNDGFKLNSRLTFPDLSDIGCQVYDARLDAIQVTDLGGSVRLNWDRINSADKYEIMYRIEGADTWDYLDEISADESDLVTYLAQGLSVGQTYKFMVRPIQVNRNMAGDTAQGAWEASGYVTVTTVPPSTPPTTPTPTPTPTPSATPSVTPTPTPTPTPSATPSVTPTPVPVVALKSQVSPTVPKSLAVKKTIKFTMKTKAGLALAVSSSGSCKTTKITVKKKVGKKFVTTQTGWLVTAIKKGSCSVKFKAPGNTAWKPLNETKKVLVK